MSFAMEWSREHSGVHYRKINYGEHDFAPNVCDKVMGVTRVSIHVFYTPFALQRVAGPGTRTSIALRHPFGYGTIRSV